MNDDSNQASDNKMPAWIICEDLLVKMREELLEEAMSILDKERQAGHIEVNGKPLSTGESGNYTEEALYIINNLIADAPKLHEEYARYISVQSDKKLSEADAKRFKELKDFVLAIDELSLLMDYSRILSAWAEEVAHYVKDTDPAEILKKTSNDPEELRKEVLKFFISNKTFASKSPLSEHEINIVSNALL